MATKSIGVAASGTTDVTTRSETLDLVARYNQYTGSPQSFGNGDQYVTGSSIAIPSNIKSGTRYHCMFNAVKTGASTATPIINVRFGTNASIADTSRGTLTFSAQTGVIDEGVFHVWVTFNSVGSGSSAVLQTLGQLSHRLSITGFGTGVSEPEIATSAGFDSTVASSKIGISVNSGASSNWTVTLVQAELTNLA